MRFEHRRRSALGSTSARLAATAAMLLAAAGTTLADDVINRPSLDQLRAQYPGVQARTYDGSVTQIFGRPMTTGASARAAADQFVTLHAPALGARAADLSIKHEVTLLDGKFTAVQYSQSLDGMPVEYGQVVVLVLNAAFSPRGTNEVVYAAGKVASSVIAARGVEMTLAEAVQIAAAMPAFKHVLQWEMPVKTVVLTPNGGRIAWKVSGKTGPVQPGFDAWTLFLDTQSGELIESRREIFHAGLLSMADPDAVDISGKIEGKSTPGVLPDLPSNPPVNFPMPFLNATRVGGGSGVTNITGDYTIPFAGTGSVTVQTTLDSALYIDINNQSSGGTVAGSVTGNAGPGLNILLNATPSANATAQTNVFYHANLLRWFVTQRAPGFTPLNKVIPGNVNLAQTCNAFYSSADDSINFFLAGGGCRNSAYSSVVAHEYGHFMVNERNLEQGGFGEGFADTCSMMLYDDFVIAREFFDNGGFIRDPKAANKQYPCDSGGVHDCGQILGGTWWDIRENMGVTYGSSQGLELTRDLWVAWYLVTLGGQGPSALNSAHPGTAIEVLTIDDDDGILGNGTPNYAQICAAFGKHNIDCPELVSLVFSYPNGLPALVNPTSGVTFQVKIDANLTNPAPGTQKIFWNAGSGFQNAPLVALGGNLYNATIPAITCGTPISYYLSSGGMDGGTYTDPSQAPIATYKTVSGQALQTQTLLDADFQSGLPAGSTTTGLWNVTSSCLPAASCAGGSVAYYGIPSQCTFNNGSSNVGTMSIPLDLSTVPGGGTITLTYCYARDDEGGNPWDFAEVRFNGSPVDTNPPGSPGGFTTRTIDMTAFAGQNGNLEFFYDTVDSIANDFLGWMVDGVKVTGESVVCDQCYADCDGSGSLNIFDYICFGNAYSAQQAYADCDGSGTFNIFDYICFGNEYAAGCP